LINTKTIFAYALPAMALAMLTGPVFALLPDYFTADVGLPLAATGTALLLSRLWDAVCDPLIGITADRLPTHFGAKHFGMRKLLMLLGLPMMLTGAYILFVRGMSLTPLTLGLASIVMFTGWSACKLAHDAWGAELGSDGPTRIKITGMREALALLGGLVAICIIGWGKLPGGPGTQAALAILCTLVAGLALIGWFVALRLAPDTAQRAPATLDWRSEIRSLRNNVPLRRLVMVYLVNGLANALPATLFLPFVVHGLGRPDLQGPLILLYFICAIAGVPLWIWAGKRFGTVRAWAASMGLAACTFVPAYFLTPGDHIWFALVCVGTGVCLGGDMLLPPAIQADILDDDQQQTGRTRAGLLFAILSFIAKLAAALAPFIGFTVLAMAGFDNRSGAVNSTSAIATLALLYALVPAGLKLCAVAMLQKWRSGGKAST
jgi:glycoside/pentoside/hexuronide:cation symporter, GPH family